MSLCEKTHMQLPLVGLEAKSEENPNLPKNSGLPAETGDSEAKRKRRAKKKRYYDRVMADPARKAKKRAKYNAWRKAHRKKHGSYPTQAHLDKASAMQRRLYHDKYKHDPEYKAKRKATRVKFQATERSLEYQRTWRANRLRTDPEYRIYSNLLGRVHGLLGRRNNRKGTVELLGCSVPEFKARLEQQWEPGMSWENYGKGEGKWSIDHIRPCASFNLLDPVQVSECFHFSNLRPSWDNSKKKSWYEGKHWFRGQHPRYSPEICASPHQLPPCPPAAEVAQSPHETLPQREDQPPVISPERREGPV